MTTDRSRMMSELKRIYEGLNTVAEASEGPYKPALRAWVNRLSDLLPNRRAELVLRGNGPAYTFAHTGATVIFGPGMVNLDGTFTTEQLLAIYERLTQKAGT